MRHFPLIYDMQTSRFKDQREFDDSSEATAAYEAAERSHLLDGHVQIVLVASDSLETVKVTHGNFFEGTDFDEVFRSILAKPAS